jgi:hypothetical protein
VREAAIGQGATDALPAGLRGWAGPIGPKVEEKIFSEYKFDCLIYHGFGNL